jgi:Domain of unknown function (DUF4340)
MANEENIQKKESYVRRLIWLVAILLLVGIAYFVSSKQKSRLVAPLKTVDFIDFLPGRIDNFSINRMGEVVDFKKTDQIWYVLVNSIPRLADSSALNDIIDMITNIEVGGMESENPAKQILYQVDTLTGTRLEFRHEDQVLGSFIVGKNAQGHNYSYIRKTGADQVYRAKDLMSYQFNKPLSGWRDKTFLTVDTAHLAEIEFIYNKEKLVLNKKDSLWLASGTGVSGDVAVDRDSINAYLRLISDLKVDDYVQVSDREFINCDNPQLTLVFTFSDNRSERLIFCGSAENNNRFYLKNEGGDETYILFDARYNELARRTIYFVSIEKNG